MKDEGVLNKISKGDKILMEASKKIEDLNLSDFYSDLYDVEKDRQMAEKAMEEYISEEATKQGIEQGISSRNIEIAKNMINNEIELSIISKCTGLSKEEIEKLK